MSARCRIMQDGLMVVQVEGPDGERVKREIAHYATLYAEEGPLEVQEWRNRKWRPLL